MKTSTALRNVSSVSVRCQSVSRSAVETSVPSVSFTPNRGKVEKKVSSTPPIRSRAFRLRSAIRSTTGVSFEGVKTKFSTTAVPTSSNSSTLPAETALIRMILFVRRSICKSSSFSAKITIFRRHRTGRRDISRAVRRSGRSGIGKRHNLRCGGRLRETNRPGGRAADAPRQGRRRMQKIQDRQRKTLQTSVFAGFPCGEYEIRTLPILSYISIHYQIASLEVHRIGHSRYASFFPR